MDMVDNNVSYLEETGDTMEIAIKNIETLYGGNYDIIHYEPFESKKFFKKKKQIRVLFKIRTNKEKSDSFSQRKEEIYKAAKKSEKGNFDIILDSMKLLQNDITEIKNSNFSSNSSEHKMILKIRKILDDNDFSPKYIDYIVTKLKTEATQGDLENEQKIKELVLNWISDTINIYDYDKVEDKKTAIFVGPTGVGKTTTIVKFAYKEGISKNKSIFFLNLDNFKIGGEEQIKTYADILGADLKTVSSSDEVKKIFLLNMDKDIIIVDTPGRGPNDYDIVKKVQDRLACVIDYECFLVIAGTTKYKDIEKIINNFEIFNYNSIIFSKIDETFAIGNIISIMYETGKSVSFFTDGQSVVPENIPKAEKSYLLNRLIGFGDLNKFL